MNKLIIGVITSIVFATVIINSAYSDDTYSDNIFKKDSNKTFKVFDDGVTYKTYDSWDVQAVNIIYNGTEYDCQPSGYHNNQYLNPICIEIILRSLP